LSSTVDYLNANADWRFVIADVRDAAGALLDLTGLAVSVTFRPDADRTTDIADCSTTNGAIAVTPGTPADSAAVPPVLATGPTLTVIAPALGRTWKPTRPMLVVGDVMVTSTGANPATEAALKRLAFVALPGT
jgi:hypothetical protein